MLIWSHESGNKMFKFTDDSLGITSLSGLPKLIQLYWKSNTSKFYWSLEILHLISEIFPDYTLSNYIFGIII